VANNIPRSHVWSMRAEGVELPRDGTLTDEERRLFAILEGRAARAGPSIDQFPAGQSNAMWFYSQRVGAILPWLVLLVGTVLMLATFARWPAVGIGGVILEAIGLWFVLGRRAWPISVASKRLTSKLRSRR
jgi:hypothetical protein